MALGVARVATRGGPVKKQRDLDLRLRSAGNDTNVKTPAYILSLRCLGQVYRYFSELWMIIPCIYMTRYFHNDTLFSQYRKMSHLLRYCCSKRVRVRFMTRESRSHLRIPSLTCDVRFEVDVLDLLGVDYI